jgi:hypothetical protein
MNGIKHKKNTDTYQKGSGTKKIADTTNALAPEKC